MKYKIDSETLTDIADAIRAKTGDSASMTPLEMPDEIASISGGESDNVEVGTFTVASDIAVTESGVDVTIGFSGQPDMIYCWMDADDFDDLDTYVNNRWYRWLIMKKDSAFATMPSLKSGASTLVQSIYANAPYLLAVSSSLNTNSDPDCASGYALGTISGYSEANVSLHSINSNGTLTLARFSSAASTILAAKYHYIAITGASIFMP